MRFVGVLITVFHRVVELILLQAALPVDRRGCDETREDVLHCMATLRRYRAKPWRDGVVEPAVHLVSERESWNLLWALAEIRRCRAAESDCKSRTVDLMQALKCQFDLLMAPAIANSEQGQALAAPRCIQRQS